MMTVGLGTLATLLGVLVSISLAHIGLAVNAWRRARSAEIRTDRLEHKIDVILKSLGIDPDDPPEYPLREVSREPRADGGRSDD